ncbi:cupin domain-containing protein [Leptolyngbya sp. FACHB-671]|uniref:cupin domain-containing protein n=1 Tax=Leptolyngbya sp. FACHB-671 TaxID=2692812 RepID=UPI001686DD74|nr:cupin domain-containing protein [Leptolyngbya sp. FACHB-671]MBD2066262.1 cupin domain-containing protein [Leptolyngbya sp. FACHB-671]
MNQPPISAQSVPAASGKTIYPEPYAAQVKGRLKRKLGECFGLTQFGVNLTHLSPGAVSALAHSHSKQDEFIYILEGNPTLVLAEQELPLAPGDCYGFKAGTGIAHQLVNRTQETVIYLEMGDRTAGDEVVYPNDDLKVIQSANREWIVMHKDGRPY